MERRVVEIILQHHRNSAICKALRIEGIKTVNGCNYTPAHISRIVSPKYIKNMLGIAVSEPFFNSGDNTQTPIELPGAWPALISQAEADALRLLHSDNQRRIPQALLTRKYERKLGAGGFSRFPASGIFKCAICGSCFTATSGERGDTHARYHAFVCMEGAHGNPLHFNEKYLQVSRVQGEEAILRACFIEAKLPPEPQITYIPPKQGRNDRSIVEITEAIKELGRKIGQMPSDVWQIMADALAEELEQAQSAAIPITPKASVEDALSVVTDPDVADRILMTSLVTAAFYPVMHNGRKCIKVIMHSGRTYLCPIHRPTYKGQRVVIRGRSLNIYLQHVRRDVVIIPTYSRNNGKQHLPSDRKTEGINEVVYSNDGL